MLGDADPVAAVTAITFTTDAAGPAQLEVAALIVAAPDAAEPLSGCSCASAGGRARGSRAAQGLVLAALAALFGRRWQQRRRTR